MDVKNNHINWNTYFMALVELNAMRSKDPNTKVGAIIVNNLNQVLASGYNGLPRGLSDDNYPWDRTNKNWDANKYPYVVHAELNAVVNSSCDITNSTIYVSLFPCNECAKIIIQKGISKIYYGNDKYKNNKENIAAKKMFDDAKVVYEKITPVKVNIEEIKNS